MIKDLPPQYTEIDQISPDINSQEGILLYYVLAALVIAAGFVPAVYISATEPAANAVKLHPPATPDIWWYIIFFAIYASGISLDFLGQFGVFRCVGAPTIYRSRRIASSSRYSSERLIPTWLSSVWAPKHAFPKLQYLLILIVPLAATVFALLGLDYLSQRFLDPGLGFQFAIGLCLELFIHCGRLFLFARLLLLPASVYFVDSQAGLHIYDVAVKAS